jgi:hypothetical protein
MEAIMDQNLSSSSAAPDSHEPLAIIKTALDVQHKIEVEGRTQGEVAAEYHKSEKWVRNMIAVSKLTPESRKALEAGRGYRKLIKSAKPPKEGSVPVPMGTPVPTPQGDKGNGGTEAMGTGGNARERVISAVPPNGHVPVPMGTPVPTPQGTRGTGEQRL